jgi:hypothetical protein
MRVGEKPSNNWKLAEFLLGVVMLRNFKGSPTTTP